METATAAPVTPQTEARTIADLLPVAVADHGSIPAVRYKDALGELGLEDLHRGRRNRPQALARPDGPGDREGGQGRDPLQHQGRVDLLRLRRAHRRRDRGPDLPDQLGRGMPVCARELGRQDGDRRGRGADGEDPRGPRPVPGARARDPDRGRLIRRDLDADARRARRRGHARALGGALALGHRRRHLHLHLHVRDHGPAEGLRDLARQLPGDVRHGARGRRPRGG